MKCPGCGDKDAYVGLREVKCASVLCRFFDNDYATEVIEQLPEIGFDLTVTEVRPASELQKYSSSAGYRQQMVVPREIAGKQDFMIPTMFTPIMLDRVYLVANGLQYSPPAFIEVTDRPSISFTVTWLGAFDLTPEDDVLVVWFTD